MEKKRKKASASSEIIRRLKKNKGAMLGLFIIIIFMLVAIFADVISPYERGIVQNSKALLNRPSAQHFFGTDHLGRDVFTRMIHGARVSLTIGISTTIGSMFFGLVLGACAAYYGGKTDEIIMRIMDMLMCIPSMLLALAIIAAMGSGLVNLMIAICISIIPGYARLIRSVALTIVENDFIKAAKACGTRDLRIIYKHIIPNAIGPIIVQATMSVASMILLAAGFSFIGMGIQPPAPEWGSMLSEAREYLRRAPYLMTFPGLAILLSALSFNLLGDGLRDALDPRLKN